MCLCSSSIPPRYNTLTYDAGVEERQAKDRDSQEDNQKRKSN